MDYTRKQMMARHLEEIGVPDDRDSFPGVVEKMGISNNIDLCMLRSIVLDQIYELRRQGRDSEKERAFLSWLQER